MVLVQALMHYNTAKYLISINPPDREVGTNTKALLSIIDKLIMVEHLLETIFIKLSI